MSWVMVFWILLSVLFFVAGLLLSWRRAQRRMQRQIDDMVKEEFHRELSRRVAQQLAEGPLDGIPPQEK